MKSCLLFLMLAACLATMQTSQACTVFQEQILGREVVAQNTDWVTDTGFVFVNPRGVKKKQKLIPGRFGKTASWTSLYGSITFSFLGLNYPVVGVNENGLAVHLLELSDSKPRKKSGKDYVGEVELGQMLLDQAGNVSEAIEIARKASVASFYTPTHFFVCDRLSRCAVIEFVDKEVKTYTGASLPYRRITNRTYDFSLRYLSMHKGFGGNQPIPQSYWSQDRFVRINHSLLTRPQLGPFQHLNSSKQSKQDPWPTWLQTVYSLDSGMIEFRTLRAPELRTVSLKNFSFECSEGYKMYDTEQGHQGAVGGFFAPYDHELVKERFLTNAAKSVKWAPKWLLKSRIYQPSECQN